MRDIRFRAWDTDNKLWVDKGNLRLNGWGKSWSGDLFDRCNYALMQFTGLHDRNGKEIYEGDIVAFTSSSNQKVRWPIVWDTGEGRWCFGYDTGEPAKNITRKEMESMIVIGNIWENPDLLPPQEKSEEK